MREVAPRAAYLPDPVVRLPPLRLEVIEEFLLDRPCPRLGLETEFLGVVERVHDLAVDIQLLLVARGVSDANRLGPQVAGEPGHLELGQAPLPRDPVHDLEVRRI